MLKSILSGHNIITTIHSNDCKSSIERIIHLCKEQNNLDQTLLGNMATDLFDIGIHLNQEMTESGIRRSIVEVVEYIGYDEKGAIINPLFKLINVVNKVNNEYKYIDKYEYGKISSNLFNKFARKKALNKNIERFLKNEYYEKENY